MELPKHILTALKTNKTSLGDHPAFPPDEEEKFIVYLMADVFKAINSMLKSSDMSYEDMKKELSSVMSKCQKLEMNNKESLEKLCSHIVNDLFDIPSDMIDLQSNLVDRMDKDQHRLLPERMTDFSFDDIDDMNNLTDEIYKRRMLNALVIGASMYYMNSLTDYVKDIFDIDEELPAVYSKMLVYNNILLFVEKDKINKDNTTMGGKVDVSIAQNDKQPTIKAKALFFPILLEETIRGILELAVSHGLPKKMEKAKYVMAKADFRLAEMWDTRLGFCLWKRIVDVMDDCGYDMKEIGANFFLMTLSEMSCDEFNRTLKEIFVKSKKGKELLGGIVSTIMHQKEQDDFDDFITTKNSEFINLNDEDDYYTADELLINDSEIY